MDSARVLDAGWHRLHLQDLAGEVAAVDRKSVV